MLKKFKIQVVIYLLVFLISLLLLTRFWLPRGFTLAGHDSGLPLDSASFLISRLYAWNPNIGFGMDNSHLFGSLSLHLIDYLSSIITNTSYAGNWFNIFIWLSLILLAATFFAYNFRKIFGMYFVFLFPIFIIFNLYLFQSIYILERAKYSILVSTLIFSTILIKVVVKKIPMFIAVFFTALVFTIFNSGSLLGISLYGNPILITLGLLLFYLVYDFKNRDFSHVGRLLLFLVLTIPIFILLNIYQVLPYLSSVFDKSYISHIGSETISQSKEWVNYISRDTSILNIFRMQGVPNLYSQFGDANSEHPYAAIYLNNWFFIFVSYIFPVLSFFGILLARKLRQRKYFLMFMVITLLTIPFAAGTHAPFGFIYSYLYDHFPGFFVFRNPFYKFVGAYFISIGFLLAASLSLTISRFSSKILRGFFCLLVIGGWLGYHYNLFIPDKIFSWKTGMYTKIQVPEYVWDFNTWNSKENVDGSRILLLPSLTSSNLADSYQWGYWSLSPLTYSLPKIPGLINEADLTGEEKSWIGKIYSSLDCNNQDDFNKFASRLGVKYLLIRKDVEDSNAVKRAEKNLSSLSSIEKIQSFNKWNLYRVNIPLRAEIESVNSLTLVNPGDIYLSREFPITGDAVVQANNSIEEKLAPFIVEKTRTYSCQSCILEKIRAYANFPTVRVFPNSPFYFLKERREQKSIELTRDDGGKIINYLTNVFRRTAEVKSMLVLEIEDKFIVDNVEKINKYSDEVIFLLNKHSELKTDYLMVKQILDTVNPLLNEYRRFVKESTFGKHGSSVREAIYKEIGLLNEVENYYSSVVGNTKYLRDTKTYVIGNEAELYLDTESVSKDIDGNISLPTEIKYLYENKSDKLELEKSSSRWRKIVPLKSVSGGAVLNLSFNLPNVFSVIGKDLQDFPTGLYACISGEIFNFNPNKDYEISIQANNKVQRLALYNSKLEKLVDIYPLETTYPFRYIYEPRYNIPSSNLMLCTDDRDFPNIFSLEVYELVSPVLVAVNKTDITKKDLVNIKYQKINNTEYKISVLKTPKPIIINFNERYNSFWKIRPENENWFKSILSIENNNHFSLDGYTNSWIINPSNESEWIIEYVPQKLFYTGAVVSIFSFSIFTIICLWKKFK